MLFKSEKSLFRTSEIKQKTMPLSNNRTEVEVYTTNEIFMTKSMEYKGIVMVTKMKTMTRFNDEVPTEIREKLLQSLKEKAAKLGANAVVGLRTETNLIFKKWMEFLWIGTAVFYTRD